MVRVCEVHVCHKRERERELLACKQMLRFDNAIRPDLEWWCGCAGMLDSLLSLDLEANQLTGSLPKGARSHAKYSNIANPPGLKSAPQRVADPSVALATLLVVCKKARAHPASCRVPAMYTLSASL